MRCSGADAGQTGDGGKVIVWADGDTRFYGNISGRGGAQSGNGQAIGNANEVKESILMLGGEGPADLRENVLLLGGDLLIAAGGRTGRDGLKGATFSSVSLTTSSHEEDQTAVQIGNPIEEKKASDLILNARAEGLIVFVTDCGAGGFSSAAGEMLSEVAERVWYAVIKES